MVRRSIRAFTDDPVDPDLLRTAVAEALTAPAPHHTHPVRFVWLRSRERRETLLHAMRERWRTDLATDGLSDGRIERRVGRGDILFDAPEVIIPFCVPDGAHDYPDARRQQCETTMFTVAVGAAVQGLLVSLATKGIGTCWVGSTIFAADVVRKELGLPDEWAPLGAIAIGHPEQPLTPRTVSTPGSGLVEL